MKKSKGFIAALLALILIVTLSFTLMIGTDTDWGSIVNKKPTTPDGDIINTLLYRPKSAAKENPASAQLAECSHCMQLCQPPFFRVAADLSSAVPRSHLT